MQKLTLFQVRQIINKEKISSVKDALLHGRLYHQVSL